MNIVHFTHGKVNPEGGSGISRVVYTLNKHEKLLGHNSIILSVVDGVKKHETYVRDEFVTIEMFPRIGFIFRKNPIFDYIKANSSKIDIVHIHHMWFYDKNPLIGLCNLLGIPIIMTLHDNYNKYLFNIKKKIAWQLFEKKYAKKVTAYRALCKEELSRIRKLGIENYIYLNYNSISAKNISNIKCPEIIEKNRDKLILTNISRINKRKNQLEIIEAVNMLDDSIKGKLLILIIGSGDNNYIKKMGDKIKEYNLDSFVKLIGPIYNDTKWNYLNFTNGYIHVSHSDVVSISVLEAMSSGKPCIITRSCKVSYLYNKDFFVMCEPYAIDIKSAIQKFVKCKDRHENMGKNAKELVDSKFSHEVIISEMIKIYNKVI